MNRALFTMSAVFALFALGTFIAGLQTGPAKPASADCASREVEIKAGIYPRNLVGATYDPSGEVGGEVLVRLPPTTFAWISKTDLRCAEEWIKAQTPKPASVTIGQPEARP